MKYFSELEDSLYLGEAQRGHEDIRDKLLTAVGEFPEKISFHCLAYNRDYATFSASDLQAEFRANTELNIFQLGRYVVLRKRNKNGNKNRSDSG